MPRNYLKELKENNAELKEAEKSLKRLDQEIAQHKDNLNTAALRGAVAPGFIASHKKMIKNLESQYEGHLNKFIEIHKQRAAIKEDWRENLIQRGNEVGVDVDCDLSSKALAEYEKQICIKELQNTLRKSPKTEEKKPHASASSQPMTHKGYLYKIAKLVAYIPPAIQYGETEEAYLSKMERELRPKVMAEFIKLPNNTELKNALKYLKATPEKREAMLAEASAISSDSSEGLLGLKESLLTALQKKLNQQRSGRDALEEKMLRKMDLMEEIYVEIEALQASGTSSNDEKILEMNKMIQDLQVDLSSDEASYERKEGRIADINKEIKELKAESTRNATQEDEEKVDTYYATANGVVAAQQYEQPLGLRR